MFLAALALLLPQDFHQGADYSIEVPSERLTVRESSTDRYYLLEVLDPSAQAAQFPPLRVLFVKGESSRKKSELNLEVRLDTRKTLEEMGATLGELQDVKRFTKGHYDFAQWYPVTDPEGNQWRFQFLGLRHGKHLAVVSLCMPADLESQRSKDAIAALASLEYRGFDLDEPMQFNLFGVRCALPLHYVAREQQNAQAGILEAQLEGTTIQVRVFQTASAGAAIDQAHGARKTLARQVKDTIENAELDYSVRKDYPTVHIVNGRSVHGRLAQIWGHSGAPDGWRHDLIVPMGDKYCLVTAVIRARRR